MQFDMAKSRIGLFLLLTLALSSIFYALIIASGHLGGGLGFYVKGLVAIWFLCNRNRLPIDASNDGMRSAVAG